LRSNTKGYNGKTHYTDSHTSDTTAPSRRELYHLQFSLQAASPGTFGYTLVLFTSSYLQRKMFTSFFITYLSVFHSLTASDCVPLPSLMQLVYGNTISRNKWWVRALRT